MATRMQQRRGTAAQWISTNSGNGPVLNSGEIGYESDTNKFKIGDGVNHWLSLSYFVDLNTTIAGAPGLLNSLDEIAAAIGDDPSFFTTVATNLTNHQNDTTAIHGIADTSLLVTTTGTQTLTNKTLTSPAINTPTGITKSDVGLANVDNTTDANKPVSTATQTALDLKSPLASPTFTGTVSGVTKAHVGLGNVDNTADSAKPISTATQSALDAKASSTDLSTHASDTTSIHGIADTSVLATETTVGAAVSTAVAALTKSSVGLGNVNNTSDANKPVSSATQSALDLKSGKIDPTFVGTTTTGDLVVNGDLTVNSGEFLASATSITIEDNLIQLASANATNTVDLGLVVAYNDGAAKHSGIVRDVSADRWKLFKGITSTPTTTVDFTQGSFDNLQVNEILASSLTIGNVNNTEFGYLDGVTSLIQDQINTKAPIDSPTFTGTVSGVTKSHVGLGSVDNTADTAKPISTATQTALDLKAPKDSPNFTGTVLGITKSMVGLANVDNTTDIGKPISTATQTALDLKLALSTAASTYAPIASPTFTGTVSGITKSMVSLGNVDNTTDVEKPVSTSTQTALDLKANLASPTFTGTVSGVTKSHVGLGAVDNTADSAKPISTATQTALDAKLASATAASTYAPLASPTFTGTVSGVTKSHVGLGNVDNTADSAKPISTATQTALDLKAPLASPTFTGVPVAPTAAVATNTTQVATTAYVRAEVAALVNSAGSTLDTLGEIATALGNDANLSTTLTTSIGLKAPLASPTFTGTVTVAASGIAFTDGTQTKEGVPSRTTISQKTASYTLAALAERDSMIEMNSASATTLTVPTNATVAWPVGTSIDVLRVGAGAVDVAAAGGVTINATPGLKLRAQWSSATLIKRATDTWVLVGDLSA